MDEPAESVATVDGRSSRAWLRWVEAVRRQKVERAVWPVLVVVAAVEAEDVQERWFFVRIAVDDSAE
jgi:hypothetical protein